MHQHINVYVGDLQNMQMEPKSLKVIVE